ncbi:MAG: hypothetical protein QOD09_3227 [Bradyrhizobium sp.]|nr:hypothetical protein [Bradyrhizobium sp.]
MNALAMDSRETAHEAGGYVKGVAIAIVTQNRDPEGLGRVKVRFPWYENSNESYWARVAVPMAGSKQGTYFLPEKDQEVLVAFEREDVRFPYVIGALWNGKDTPPTTNSDGKNDQRLIRSRKGHQLMFDDGAKGLVELKLDDGKKLAIDDNGIRLDDGKGNSLTIDSNSGALDIKAIGQLTIKAPKITLDASASLEIKAGATMTIRGTLVQIN